MRWSKGRVNMVSPTSDAHNGMHNTKEETGRRCRSANVGIVDEIEALGRTTVAPVGQGTRDKGQGRALVAKAER